MDATNSRNRRPVREEVQYPEISEGRAALDDDFLCSQLSRRPTPIPIPRRTSGLVTYPVFDEADTLATDTLDQRELGTCCSRTHNQSVRDYYNLYFSDMARQDHSKVLGYRPIHIITRLESATCFHDYTYQLQSSSLDMSFVTWPNTITSWSEFLLLDAGNYFPQLKHSSGNTLVNILPMSAELVNKYLSDVQDQSTSAIDVIADLFCSDA